MRIEGSGGRGARDYSNADSVLNGTGYSYSSKPKEPVITPWSIINPARRRLIVTCPDCHAANVCRCPGAPVAMFPDVRDVSVGPNKRMIVPAQAEI
jgi:hypothetical protein